MLDVRPVDVLPREVEVGLDRLARVVGVADDQPADDEHAVAVKHVDRGQRRIRPPALLPCRLFFARAFRNARSSSSTFSMPRNT